MITQDCMRMLMQRKIPMNVEMVYKLSLKKMRLRWSLMKRVVILEEKVIYSKIKEYDKEKYGVNMHTSRIAQVNRICGLDMGGN